MSKMAMVAHLTEKGDKDALVDYFLNWCNFRTKHTAEIAADNFLKAQKEREEEGNLVDELKEKNNEMQSMRVRQFDKIPSKKKNSVPSYRTVKRNTENT